MNVAIVVWLDAHSCDEFEEHDDALDDHKPKRVTSVGILLKHDEIGVTIVRDIDDERVVDGRLFIPAGMVVSVTIKE